MVDGFPLLNLQACNSLLLEKFTSKRHKCFENTIGPMEMYITPKGRGGILKRNKVVCFIKSIRSNSFSKNFQCDFRITIIANVSVIKCTIPYISNLICPTPHTFNSPIGQNTMTFINNEINQKQSMGRKYLVKAGRYRLIKFLY